MIWTKMKYSLFNFIVIIFTFSFFGCLNKTTTYEEILTRVSKHKNVFELTSDDGISRILVCPELQGKIITTTYGGKSGTSMGWINEDAINANGIKMQILGGEERLWFGPLGSQHSFYYQQIEPLNEDNWQVPKNISSSSYDLESFTSKQIVLSISMHLKNFIGTEFTFDVLRKISLLDKKDIANHLNFTFDDTISHVAYETNNVITNNNNSAWSKETGLVSIWSANMFAGTDATVVAIPLVSKASYKDIHKYFNSLDSTRLKIFNNTLLFKADASYRSKVGIPFSFATDLFGSYSKKHNRLTLVQYNKGETDQYSNSNVSFQQDPYKHGEVIPIYNNGKNFYELESVSASLALAPKENLTHYHRVYHFTGDKVKLNKIAKVLLRIELADISL